MAFRLPAARDIRATLDEASGSAVVVACPPHPQLGGDRRDGRLRAVSSALVDSGIDCCRFDYGPWDDGRGEQQDVRDALAWAHEEYPTVGLFGYSFGGSMAILASSSIDESERPAALSTLAPGAAKDREQDVVSAFEALACPVQLLYGERDDVVSWEPLVDRGREQGFQVESLPADHFFVGQQTKIADLVAEFFDEHLERS